MKPIVTTIFIIIFIILIIWYCKTNESLSLSQFPYPECTTNRSGQFYSCDTCTTLYQQPNELDATCDCGGFTTYQTRESPSCYKDVLKKGPCKCGRCQEKLTITDKVTGEKTHVCVNPDSTFDNELDCPVPFPFVTADYKPYKHKQLMHTSEADLFSGLEKGDLILISKNGKIIENLFKQLVIETSNKGLNGYPDFYYIDGPIVALKKIGDNYHYMIDYPVKYTPQFMENYVNKTPYWNVAKTFYQTGKKLLDLNAPVIWFSNGKNPVAKNTPYACQSKGSPQSSTDYYHGDCSTSNCALNKPNCRYGAKYGSGNWLHRV